MAPAINAPITPKFLFAPRESNGYREGRPHLAPPDFVNLLPAFGRVVGKTADKPQRNVWLVLEQAFERLMKRRWRMIEIIVPLDANIVHVIAVFADGKVDMVEHALLILSALRFRDGPYLSEALVIVFPFFPLSVVLVERQFLHKLGFSEIGQQIGIDLRHDRREGNQIVEVLPTPVLVVDGALKNRFRKFRVAGCGA